MAEEVNVRIAGAAGQGIQTTMRLLGKAAARAGLWSLGNIDAESRIRGGLNYCQVRIATTRRAAIVEGVDILVAHTERALQTYAGDLSPTGVLLAEEPWEHPSRLPIDLGGVAKTAGAPRAAGVVSLGAIWAMLGQKREIVERVVEEHFKSGKLLEINRRAVALGYEATEKQAAAAHLRLPAGNEQRSRLLVSGAEAIALGAVAGGVAVMTAYPMSPSTGIMVNLAQWARQAGIVVEQAEDEIAAINMMAGAWYAGARAMTATSGGGFDLMAEGVSLLGMIESPGVIVIAQRAGPSTGLATRTAQSDLRLALHAGHGTFARVIVAPRNICEAFAIAARAFDVAERFQIPVFILTDQQLQDGEAVCEPFEVSQLPSERHFLSPAELAALPEYRRFAITESGLSPMAAPGASPRLVVVSSDEHDELGRINAPRATAEAMGAKRLRKIATVEAHPTFPPELEGEPEDGALVIGWGSSYETIAEARRRLAGTGRRFAQLHLTQLWPLPGPALEKLIDRAPRTIVVENSPAGELADLLQQAACRRLTRRIGKYDGRPFDELAMRHLSVPPRDRPVDPAQAAVLMEQFK